VFVAETPIDDPGDDRRNVAMLWDWRIERAGAGGGEGVLHADGGAEERELPSTERQKKREKIRSDAENAESRREDASKKKHGEENQAKKKKRG